MYNHVCKYIYQVNQQWHLSLIILLKIEKLSDSIYAILMKGRIQMPSDSATYCYECAQKPMSQTHTSKYKAVLDKSRGKAIIQVI